MGRGGLAGLVGLAVLLTVLVRQDGLSDMKLQMRLQMGRMRQVGKMRQMEKNEAGGRK